MSDLKTAVRALRNNPIYAGVVVLSLSVGIAGCVLTFALLEARGVQASIHAPDQVVRISASINTNCGNGCADTFEGPLLSRLATSRFASVGQLAPYAEQDLLLTLSDQIQRIRAVAVGGDFFSTLGVQPSAGRLISGTDCKSAPDLAVTSFDFAQDHFGEVRNALGAKLASTARTFTIVGVLPRGFDYPPGTRVWFGCHSWPDNAPFPRSGLWSLARLNPGFTPESAREEFIPAAAGMRSAAAESRGIAVYPYARVLAADKGRGHWALIGGVWLAFVVACANVMNLTLIRALKREREIALRHALGATKGQIVTLLLTESTLLVLPGLCLGIFVASRAMDAVSGFAAAQFGVATRMTLNPLVVFLAIGLAAIVAVVLATAPISRLRRTETATLIRAGASGISPGPGHRRLKHLLLGVQVSLVVATGCLAVIFARSYGFMSSSKTDFDVDDVLTSTVPLEAAEVAAAGGSSKAALELTRKLESTSADPPAAVMVRYMGAIIGSNTLKEPWITIEGRAPMLNSWSASVAVYGATPSLLQVLGARVIKGRDFEPTDIWPPANVAVINEAAARGYWPDLDPLGRRFKFGPANSPNPWMTVIGVTHGTTLPFGRNLALMNPGTEWKIIYRPIIDSAVVRTTVVARLSTVRPGFLAAANTAIGSVFGPRPTSFSTIQEDANQDREVVAAKVKGRVLGAAAIITMLLGLIGIQALVAESVLQRRREIGIRVALGSPSRRILGNVLRSTVIAAVAGVFVGGAFVAAVVLFASRFLLGIESRIWTPEEMVGGSLADPRGYLLVLFVVVLASAIAAFLPARHALRINPVEALRAD